MHVNKVYKKCTKFKKPNRHIKYAFKLNERDRVLILAPHPDDETLGCGGLIKKMMSMSIQLEILLLTNHNSKIHQKDISLERKKEFDNAMKTLGGVKNKSMNFSDGELYKNYKKLNKNIKNFLLEYKPNIIFVPYLLDYNLDHRICNYVVADSIKDNKLSNMNIVMYEIWTPIIYPNYYIDITKEFEIKRKAIACYKSQDDYYGLLKKAEALNKYRAIMSMRKNIDYMESYKEYDMLEYCFIIDQLKKADGGRDYDIN